MKRTVKGASPRASDILGPDRTRRMEQAFEAEARYHDAVDEWRANPAAYDPRAAEQFAARAAQDRAWMETDPQVAEALAAGRAELAGVVAQYRSRGEPHP